MDEVWRLIDATLPTYTTIVTLLGWSGLRVSEAIGLRWRDVDFVEELLRITGQLPPLKPGETPRALPLFSSEGHDGSMAEAPAADLVSFIPRLTLEWLRDRPDERWLALDGTVAFVDISGFTAMSEQLSSRGKAGAEEVTEIMNATFAALLEVAYADGGSLLKFGGDALLLFYDGDEHAARAARAAYRMRRVLMRIGRQRTTEGTVTLHMHAGLHSGHFHFFLVGDTHRELLVTGPGATRTVEMEAASEAGEILLSPETAALLEHDVLGEPKGPGVLLVGDPGTIGTFVPLPEFEAIPLEVAVPAPVREQLREVGPLEGEHRSAALAFVRFRGIDDVIRHEGAEATADALEELVRGIQAAAEQHEVTFLESDVDRDGGRIVLVAGAPRTFGDDEERLLRTVRAAVDGGLPFPVHIGVSRGRVFTGQVGATFRRTYTLLGETAALAARLMARAGEDEIWVTADAFERGGARFAADELEPFTVKGRSEPVRAFVLGALGVASAEADTDAAAARKLPFVDRERERALLGAAVAPVRLGFGTLVELIGEPGIGKSRLAEELESYCADMTKISARCEQYEATTPYYPFRSLLRPLLGVELNGGGEANRAALAERLGAVDEELVPWAPLLGAPLDVEVESTPEVDDLDPAFWRARLHGVVGKLLGELLASPTLLLFEDVHWMDDASSELLRYLGTQLPTRPWLTCTTRRAVDGGFAAAEGTPPLPAVSLRLEAIPAEDAKALARAAAGERALTEDEIAALLQRAAGNPLFLQELAASDAPREKLEEMPETVEALVAARIDKLSAGDRALLRWASVLGTSFSASLIADVLEADSEVAPASEAWNRLREFVEFDPDVAGHLRFRHSLIRDAAYEGLAYKRRRELHGRVAEVLERRREAWQEDAAELLSLHFHRAERWPEAWRYSVDAGRRAQAKYANVEAAEFYRRALDAAKRAKVQPTEVAAVWEALGDCLQLAGELREAARAFASARRLYPEASAERVELLHKEGSLREDMGRYAEAIRWYERGFRAAELVADEGVRAHLQVELSLGYAEARFRQGELEDCIARCNEVVAQALEIDDDPQLASAYMLLHMVHMLLGNPERAAFRGLALPIFEDLGDLKRQATALNNLGVEAYYEGDWDKAVDVYERSLGLFKRIGDVTNVAVTTNNIGEILADRGRLNEADELFETARSTAESAGQRLWATLARLNLGRTAARARRRDEADQLLREAREAFVEIGAESFVLECDVRIAEAEAMCGARAAEALAQAESVLARLDGTNLAAVRAVALRVRGVALFQSGRREPAIVALNDSIAVAEDAGLMYEKALALDLLGSTESGEILGRLGVEQVMRPPLEAA